MSDPENNSTGGTSSSSNLTIDFKLTGKEVYTTWMFAMTTLLSAYGLADYIDSSKSATAKDPVKKSKAMLAITRNVDFAQLAIIKAFPNDPAGAWAALSAEYAGKSSQDMATLLIELFGLRLQANASISDAKKHFESMTDLNLRLREIDKNRALPDLVIAVLMCMSLPNDMEQVRCRRLSGPAEELTPSNVRDDVVSLLRRMAVAGDVPNADGGQAMQSNKGRRGGFNGKCFGCGKLGHRRADCRSKSGGLHNDGAANLAMISTALSAAGGTPRKGLRDWVVDGAATCGHVSTHHEHFQGDLMMFDSDRRPTIGGLGGDRVEVLGKGTVVLQLATGKSVP